MAPLTAAGIRTLAEHEGTHCLSLYLPTEKAGPDVTAGAVRLKNRLQEAEQLLRDNGCRNGEVQQLLDPARSLIDDGAFWQDMDEGLALFADSALREHIRLPAPCAEFTAAGPRFHITPLLNASGDGDEYYVLAVSQHQVRLLRGTRGGIAPVALPGVPQGVDELFFDRDTADQLQFHTLGGGGAGGGPASTRGGEFAAIFHGQGQTDGPWDERLRHYFRRVNGELDRLLSGTAAPLVFAGDSSLFPIYRQVNTYPLLAESAIRGNPEPPRMSDQQLHRQSWDIVRQRLDARRGEVVGRVAAAVNTDHGSTRIAGILHAGTEGRIDTLLLASGQHEWGRFNPKAQQVQVLPRRQPEGEDLLNLAAVMTLRKGGRVVIVEPEAMPAGSKAAAMFRF